MRPFDQGSRRQRYDTNVSSNDASPKPSTMTIECSATASVNHTEVVSYDADGDHIVLEISNEQSISIPGDLADDL